MIPAAFSTIEKPPCGGKSIIDVVIATEQHFGRFCFRGIIEVVFIGGFVGFVITIANNVLVKYSRGNFRAPL